MSIDATVGTDPHGGQPVLTHGPSPATARCTVILVHGRGDSAAGILSLTDEFDQSDIAWIAPQAAGHAWYPASFLAPIERNEPALSSALHVIDGLVRDAERRGVETARIVLCGFSQGACLVSEYAARNPRRYGGVVALSGGLIGPPGVPRADAGTFDRMPALFACSEDDPFIPLARVQESIATFRRLHASVDDLIYPGASHSINADAISAVAALLHGVGR
jgi:predicted esterase